MEPGSNYGYRVASLGTAATGFPGAIGGSDVVAHIAEWVDTNFPAMTVGGVAAYDLTTPLG